MSFFKSDTALLSPHEACEDHWTPARLRVACVAHSETAMVELTIGLVHVGWGAVMAAQALASPLHRVPSYDELFRSASPWAWAFWGFACAAPLLAGLAAGVHLLRVIGMVLALAYLSAVIALMYAQGGFNTATTTYGTLLIMGFLSLWKLSGRC